MADTDKNCGKCSKVLKRTQTTIECLGCKNLFHCNCAGLSKEKIEALKNENQVWQCQICQNKQGEASNLQIGISSDEPSEISLRDIWKLLKEYRVDTARMEKDLGNSIEACHADVKALQNDNHEMNIKIANMAQEIQLLKNENIELKAENKRLTASVRNNDQYSRMNSLEIYNCPYRENEDIYQVISSIGEVLNNPVSKDILDIAHRLKPNAKGERGIIIKFIKRSDKNSFLDSYFKHKGLTTTDLSFPGKETKIFVSESLSPFNRVLIKAAREKKRRGDLARVFCRNGKILIKKQIDGPNIWVKSLDDL